MRRVAVIPIASVALLMTAFAASAGAATITPSITADEFANGGGGDAGCSLREAVAIANANSTAAEPDCAVIGTLGDDAIALGALTYPLDRGPDVTPDDNEDGDLDVDSAGGALTISGAGAAATTIDANVGDRVVDFFGAVDAALTIRDLGITGGNADTLGGGGILGRSSPSDLVIERARITDNLTDGVGGGIAGFTALLSITDSELSLNQSGDPAAATGGNGGAILAGSTATVIESSLIFDNDAVTSGNGAFGGGVSASGTALSVTNSLISENVAQDTNPTATGVIGGGMTAFNATGTIRGTTFAGNDVAGGLFRIGGAMRMTGTSDLKLVNSTLSANESHGSGVNNGGIRVDNGTLTLVHTTVGPNPTDGSSPTAISSPGSGIVNLRGSAIETSGANPACSGVITSLDGNVFTDFSCGPETGNDLANHDLLLGPLTDNGGPDAGAPGALVPITTHLPDPNSGVIDHVPATACTDLPSGSLQLDQRGLARPDDADGDGIAECESGSVELQLGGDPDPDGDGVPSSSDACPSQPGPASNGGCPVQVTPTPPPATEVPLAPAPNPLCTTLRKKLKKAKTKAAKRKIRKKLRKLGC